MKVLYINEKRHERVLRAVANPDNENIFVIPERVDDILGKQYLNTHFNKIYPNHQFNLIYRYFLAKDIKKIAEQEKPDIIHFVSADDYLRMFGFSLRILSKYNFIITLHWCRHTKLRDFSRKLIIDKVKGIIFHVKNAPVCKNKNGEIKSEFLVLPPENVGKVFDKKSARKYLALDQDEVIYSFVGLMEEYKGIDVLMKSIKYIKKSVTILLAGKPGKYTNEYFESFNKNKNVKLRLVLRFLSDEEFTQYICASDYILLPYKKEFEATSGAMTEAVRCGVPIIAPNCENLGALTNDYDFGYTFEVEKPESLAETINKCYRSAFTKSDRYKYYQKKLSVDNYRKEQQKFYERIINNSGV